MTRKHQPLVVVGLSGGIAQWDVCLPGEGVPILDILDFDREGEDDEDRREWLAYAREVEHRVRARGTYPVSQAQTALDVADEIKTSLDEMEPWGEED